jgi:hypothetical protein
MIWNPTSTVIGVDEPAFGGKHYIYVYGHSQYLLNPEMSNPVYDESAHVYSLMRHYEESEATIYKKHALLGGMWTAIPLLQEGHELLESEVRIRIRVATPYYKGLLSFATEDSYNDDFPAYSFLTQGIAS